MKMIAALALILSAQNVLAYEVKSCSQLTTEKSQLVAEMNYLSDKINSSRNSDAIEFYLEQYEALYNKYQGLKSDLDNTCK